MTLKYSAVTAPYLLRVHSVNTKPSGHLRLMMGPNQPNASRGNPLESEYTTRPWTPAMVEISGYVNKMPEPRPAGDKIKRLGQLIQRSEKGKGEGENSGSTFLTQELS